jgi:hypothetical protein
MPDWQWIPPTIASLGGCIGLGMFLWRVLGAVLKDLKDHLDRVNEATQHNTSDIAAIKARCAERHGRFR